MLGHHEDDDVNHDSSPEGKYQAWADELFGDGERRLEEQVYFWARDWRTDDTGPFYDFETNLESLEYNFINLAPDLYLDELFNTEGA